MPMRQQATRRKIPDEAALDNVGSSEWIRTMISRRITAFAAITLLWATLSPAARADDLIVEKRTFTLSSYTTVAGETIKSVKVG
jgi:hypothetical protein